MVTHRQNSSLRSSSYLWDRHCTVTVKPSIFPVQGAHSLWQRFEASFLPLRGWPSCSSKLAAGSGLISQSADASAPLDICESMVHTVRSPMLPWTNVPASLSNPIFPLTYIIPLQTIACENSGLDGARSDTITDWEAIFGQCMGFWQDVGTGWRSGGCMVW